MRPLRRGVEDDSAAGYWEHGSVEYPFLSVQAAGCAGVAGVLPGAFRCGSLGVGV